MATPYVAPMPTTGVTPMDTSKLRQTRLKLGFSQSEFAALLVHPITGKKVTPGTIASWDQSKTPRQLPPWVDAAARALEVKLQRATNDMPKTERKLGKIARAEKAEAEARARYREQYAPLTAEEQAKLDACLGGKSRG